MSGLLSFPPELLLDIFTVAAVPDPYSSLAFRQENLSSFALVNSGWTPIAQDLILEKLRVSGDDATVERRARELDKLQTRAKTKRLEIYGHIEGFFKIAGFPQWESVVNLKLYGTDWAGGYSRAVEIKNFTQLPNLLDLWLNGHFRISSLDPETSFRNLSRLVVGHSAILLGDASECQQVFSSASMPNLVHLSLMAQDNQVIPIATIFSLVLPQVRTLVITYYQTPRKDYIRLLRLVHTLPNLAHLALIAGSFDRLSNDLFPPQAKTFNLESLHLDTHYIRSDTLLATTLAEIVRGEREGFEIARIVVYDWDERQSNKRIVGIDSMEKRSYDLFAFADFDGR